MDLVKFIDNRFQELRLEESTEAGRAEYSIARDSETLALQMILKFYRSIVKWFFVPKVIVHFMLVRMGKKSAPQPVLLNKLKEQQQQELEKKAKKVGMLQAVEKQGESTTSA